MKRPCLNCEERNIYCHSNCDKYKEFVNEVEVIKQARIDYILKNRGSYKYKQATINKLRRKKR
jgi:hypothetical protein